MGLLNNLRCLEVWKNLVWITVYGESVDLLFTGGQ
jgi:hypothetical protein